MGALCAISAILTATAGLDAEQRTTLHRFVTPMLQMNGTRLRNQIKERLMIEGVQFFEIHRKDDRRFLDFAPNDKSSVARINNQTSVHPFTAFGGKDG